MARVAESRHSPARELCKYALRWPATVYVSFFRGTPLFVQILLIHFAVLPLFINPADGIVISGETARNIKQNYGAFLSGIVALTLNAGAYISEIFRAGIQSIDKGQVEASRSLGMPTKLGYKNPKHIQAIFVTNTYPGGYWEDQGYNWFGGS